MIVSSYHYLVGPLISFAALGVIVLICRWVFSTSDREQRTARRTAQALATRRGDYGLLVPVASVRTGDDAQMLRAVLHDAGIRCTVSTHAQGADVLVFQSDAPRARELVSS